MESGKDELLSETKYPNLDERPVEIKRSRLVRDGETFGIKLYLDMKNVSGKGITAVYVDVCCFDEDMEILSSKAAIPYTGLNVPDGADLGGDIALVMPSLRTANVTVALNRVDFSDGMHWSREEETLAVQDTDEIPVEEIEKQLNAREMAVQKVKRRAARDPWRSERAEEEKSKRRKKRLIGAACAAAVILTACGAAGYACKKVEAQEGLYSEAAEKIKKGEYAAAAEKLDALISDKPFGEIKQKAWRDRAIAAVYMGDHITAARGFAAADTDEGAFCLRQLNSLLSGVLAAGERHSVGLKKDGTAVAVGSDEFGQCKVGSWKELTAVAAGENHTLGRKADGTVVAVGDNFALQCDTQDWKNVTAIAAGKAHSIGVMANGRVAAAGDDTYGQCGVSSWSGIVAAAAGYCHTVGLRQDGTVVAVGNNEFGQCDVGDWKDMVSISAGAYFTVGVRRDGTVVAVGDNSYYQCETRELKSVTAVAAGDEHVLAICGGKIEAVGDGQWHQSDVWLWKSLTAAAGGLRHSLALSSDGTVYAAGDNKSGQCDVDDWKEIGLPTKALEVTSFQ